jgi:hypothetical protein
MTMASDSAMEMLTLQLQELERRFERSCVPLAGLPLMFDSVMSEAMAHSDC